MSFLSRNSWLNFFDRTPRFSVNIAASIVIVLIGFADYATGIEISLGIFYLFPILAVAWWGNRQYAYFLSLISVLIWIFGDVAEGLNPSSPLVPLWNTTLRLGFYVVATQLTIWLRTLKNELQIRVDGRALALTKEVMERERLERELLATSEREQRRIGQDLHDGLCQHLTGASLAAQVLLRKLSQRAQPEADDSRRLVAILEEAISLGRSLARGLHPVEMQPDGLMQALDEFANTTSSLFKVSCRFECGAPILIHEPAVAGHMYRIAQEAVGNAIKHGMATDIGIHLDVQDHGTVMSIEDNGIGLPDPLPKSRGIGLQIMAHRANAVGAEFKVESGKQGGTIVTCMIPADSAGARKIA